MSKVNMAKTPELAALERAIELAGTAKELAELVGVTSSAVSRWRERGGIPVERCMDVSRAVFKKCKVRITLKEMRPKEFSL